MTRIDVYVDEAGDGPVLAGVATVRRTRGVEATEFTYADGFLAGRAWPISPDLPIHRARMVIEGLPGALDDSAPDAWGRNLITRRLAAQSRDAGHVAPTPTEVDFLLGVSDATRQGALRFQVGASEFLAEGGDVPQLIDLDVLLDAVDRIARDDAGDATEDAVATLLDAGSGSLGGARPKASVRDAGRLFVAKFPHRSDRWEVIRWEAVALDLAEACGLRTP
ncbi:MAG: HipA N-terminal domain-containing protein, partial [Brevundimonas sp.]|nr:HipA N-terminal domain-containing protein [Brevundimonas sp.]